MVIRKSLIVKVAPNAALAGQAGLPVIVQDADRSASESSFIKKTVFIIEIKTFSIEILSFSIERMTFSIKILVFSIEIMSFSIVFATIFIVSAANF